MSIQIKQKIVDYHLVEAQEERAAEAEPDSKSAAASTSTATAPAPAAKTRATGHGGNGAGNIARMHEKVERPEMLVGSTYKIKTPVSEHAFYITINDMLLNPGTPYEKRRPFEMFINSKNMDHYQWISALTPKSSSKNAASSSSSRPPSKPTSATPTATSPRARSCAANATPRR